MSFTSGLAEKSDHRYLEKSAYVLEAPLPTAVDPDAPETEQRAYAEWVDADLRVRSYMLASMNSELQTRFENVKSAYEIITTLRQLYSENARVKEYNLMTSLFNMRLREGISPDDHVIKMINKAGELQVMGTDLPHNVRVSLILHSLPPTFKPFITNYNLNRIERTLPDLLNDIQEFYNNEKKGKTPAELLATFATRGKKRQAQKPWWRGSQMGSGGPKVQRKGFKKTTARPSRMKGFGIDAARSQPPRPSIPQKEKKQEKSNCFYCNQEGHWKRNCPLYLDDLRKSKTASAE
ncbi:uncharacterized protein LOC123211556 [Mangifera indica]|uniref:uncharacterized protein LOC123211556 n=1 Tax=Mangifera indica TaxID=29780 RepID=UPI001CFBB69C|nr:uncharacterized protein LOC123211556 [Mangifera indica]